MVQIPLKKKYRTDTQPKKIGIDGDHSNKARKRHRNPHPVERIRTLHLVKGRKIRFEG